MLWSECVDMAGIWLIPCIYFSSLLQNSSELWHSSTIIPDHLPVWLGLIGAVA